MWQKEGGRALESFLHKRFADKRLRGEWFDLSTSDVESIIHGNCLSGFKPPIRRLKFKMEKMGQAQMTHTAAAAEYLGQKKTTLEYWRTQGTGPRYYKFGRYIRYRFDDLDAWLEGRAVEPKKPRRRREPVEEVV